MEKEDIVLILVRERIKIGTLLAPEVLTSGFLVCKILGSRELSLVNLKDILDRILGILFIQVNKFQNVDININIDPDVPRVLASPVGMQNIFMNMCNNSYDSIQEIKAYIQSHPEIGLNGYKGRIDINISRAKDKVDIRVSDNGMGMTEDIARQLFTPNYTTKASIIGTNFVEDWGARVLPPLFWGPF